MIDLKKPVVTRDGDAAEFIHTEKHPVYPLVFRIGGTMRSYTLNGRNNVQWPTRFDVMNLADYSPATLQLTLF